MLLQGVPEQLRKPSSKALSKMLDPPEIVDRYNCSQCSHQTASLLQLDHHVQRTHKNMYAAEFFHAIAEPQQLLCFCCDYKSYYHFELYEHCKQAHNPRIEDKENMSFCEEFDRYQCDCCRYKTESSLCLVSHHDLCTKASPTFQQNSVEEAESAVSLELTRTDATTSKDVGAVKVNTPTRNSRSDKIHWFKCYHCSYLTKRKYDLKRHLLRHSAVKEILCDICLFRTRQKKYMKSHMLQHAANKKNEKQIKWPQCSHCSYRTKRRVDLKRHMLQHATDEEINWFKCNNCSYRAKQKVSLKRHMFQHAELIKTSTGYIVQELV